MYCIALNNFDDLILFMINNEKFLVLGPNKCARAYYSHSNGVFLLTCQGIILAPPVTVPSFFKSFRQIYILY